MNNDELMTNFIKSFTTHEGTKSRDNIDSILSNIEKDAYTSGFAAMTFLEQQLRGEQSSAILTSFLMAISIRKCLEKSPAFNEKIQKLVVDLLTLSKKRQDDKIIDFASRLAASSKGSR